MRFPDSTAHCCRSYIPIPYSECLVLSRKDPEIRTYLLYSLRPGFHDFDRLLHFMSVDVDGPKLEWGLNGVDKIAVSGHLRLGT